MASSALRLKAVSSRTLIDKNLYTAEEKTDINRSCDELISLK